GRIAFASDPATALEPVEDPGDGRGVQPGHSRERARAERAETVDEIEKVEVDVPQRDLCADPVVQQRQLAVELAQRVSDLERQSPPPPRRLDVLSRSRLRLRSPRCAPEVR